MKTRDEDGIRLESDKCERCGILFFHRITFSLMSNGEKVDFVRFCPKCLGYKKLSWIDKLRRITKKRND